MMTKLSDDWIVGFTDGEGCFMVSLSLPNKKRKKVDVRPAFSVDQKGRKVLDLIAEHFKCGQVSEDRKSLCFKYQIRSLDDICNYIIPFFKDHPLLTAKQQSFEIFTSVCNKMKNGLHKTPDGILEIIDDVYTINPSGTRKYTKEKFLELLNQGVVEDDVTIELTIEQSLDKEM